MRAVTGTIISSQPCPIAKVPRVLERFLDKVGSDILSSDAATYLRTAIEAADELNFFRRDLRRRHQREGGGESERARGHAPVDEDGRWEPKVEEEEEEYGRWQPKLEEEEDGVAVPAAGERKNIDNGPREEKRDIAAPHGDFQSPSSVKRRKKKEKHVKEEYETVDIIEEQSRKALDDALQGMVPKEIDSEKKAEKKKKHIKQEEELMGVKEAHQKIVHTGVAENGLASEEKKRKKRKHTEEEEVKKEVVDGGDFGSDKKRKKKRGRDGDIGNDMEVVEHKQKKQRK